MKHLEFAGDPSKKKNVTIFLHGFPGIRSVQNRDIAEQVSKLTGRHCFVPLYEGLGFSPGEFSFQACRASVETFVADLISKYGHIDLVGHSWGGYLALGLAAKHGPIVDKLVLLSPLLHFFDADPDSADYDYFRDTLRDNPQIDLGNTDERAREFNDIGRDTTSRTLAEKVDTATRVFILQAATDPVTPEVHSRELMTFLKVKPTYELVATDHSFLIDRPQATERVIAALNASV